MKSGFTLIEITIVLLISAILLISINQTFMQISKSVKSITRVIAADSPLVPFYNQLDRDITGAFAPKESLEVLAKKYSSQQDKPDKALPDQKPDKPSPDQTPKEAPKKPAQVTPKIIEDIFAVKSEQEGELVLSFITTGGLERLEKDGTISAQPYVRRVYYKQEKDPEKPDLFRIIYRTESNNLELKEIEKKNFSSSYVIMKNIKKMSYEFTVFESVKADDKSKDQAAKKPAKSQLREWKEKEVFEKYKALVPAYVKVNGSYTDANGQKEYPFDFEFKVYGYSQYDPEEQKKEPAEKSKNLHDKLSEFADKLFDGKKPDAKPK